MKYSQHWRTIYHKTMKIDKVLLSGSHFIPFNRFWVKELRRIREPYTFPRRTNKAVDKYKKVEYQSCTRKVNQQVFKKMLDVAGDEPMAWFVVITAALNYQLSKYSGEKDITISTPLFLLEPTEAALNDNLYLHFDIPDFQTIKEYILNIKDRCQQFYKYQNYPIMEADELGILTNDITNIQYYFPKVHERPVNNNSQGITFEAGWSREYCTLTVKFADSLYDRTSLEGILENAEKFLEFLDSSHQNLTHIPYLTDDEKRKLCKNFFGLEKNIDPNISIVHLFEEQVNKDPDNLCLISDVSKLSYGEVNEMVNKLARFLINKLHVGIGDFVGLMMDNFELQIIGLLAILKSRAAFVAIDPSHPEKRIQYILDESAPKALLIDSSQMNNIGSFENSVFVMDLQMATLDEEIGNLMVKPGAREMAYMIFTSGTTGIPKGVLLSHGGMSNTLTWRKEYYGFKSTDTSINFFPIIFDGSITSIFTVLISGGTMVIPEPDKKNDIRYIEDLLNVYAITNFIIIPSFYKVLLQELGSKLQNMNCVTLAGEAVSTKLVDEHYKVLPEVKLYNEYGPSENSVCTSAKLLDKNNLVTIGKPIFNTKVRILDVSQKLVPIGAKGELYIEGPGLALGYLNNQKLTSDSFIQIPSISKNLLYRTGDLGKWTQEGEIVYLGRVDQQVKINGYRIETEEINSVLKSYDYVKDALVKSISKEDSAFLAAYLVLYEDCDIEKLRSYLANILPEYMHPKHYVIIDKIPVTPTGKVDANALPNPRELDPDKQYIGPRNSIEQQLVAIWEAVLQTCPVDINDNFFEIGGNSVIAIQMVSKVFEIGYEISVKHIFDFPTIEELASLIAVSMVSNEDKRANQSAQILDKDDQNEIVI